MPRKLRSENLPVQQCPIRHDQSKPFKLTTVDQVPYYILLSMTEMRHGPETQGQLMPSA
jgi:hypothetical protein